MSQKSNDLSCFGMYKPQMRICGSCASLDECKVYTLTGQTIQCYGFCTPSEQKCLTCKLFAACRKEKMANIVKKNSVAISVESVIKALETAETFLRFASPMPSNLMDALAGKSFSGDGRTYVVSDILKSIVSGTIKIEQKAPTTMDHIKKVSDEIVNPSWSNPKKQKPPTVIISFPNDGWKEMECIDNESFEDYFDIGTTYLVAKSKDHPEDAVVAIDRYGEEREMSFVRFAVSGKFLL